jgi:hypothetical protein
VVVVMVVVVGGGDGVVESPAWGVSGLQRPPTSQFLQYKYSLTTCYVFLHVTSFI